MTDYIELLLDFDEHGNYNVNDMMTGEGPYPDVPFEFSQEEIDEDTEVDPHDENDESSDGSLSENERLTPGPVLRYDKNFLNIQMRRSRLRRLRLAIFSDGRWVTKCEIEKLSLRTPYGRVSRDINVFVGINFVDRNNLPVVNGSIGDWRTHADGLRLVVRKYGWGRVNIRSFDADGRSFYIQGLFAKISSGEVKPKVKAWAELS